MLRDVHGYFRIAVVCLIAALGAGGTQRVIAASKKSPCAEAQTQLSLTTCWTKLANAAAHRVDSRFRQVRAKLDPNAFPEAAAGFEAAHAKWREYRDAHCQAVEKVYSGGSMGPMQGAICRMRLNDARDAELKTLLSDLAGLASGK
jgi:uncharacterized protein YecT (DUF1311 family)